MSPEPFLDDAVLQEAYRTAKAVILPSEIEGFGLPALEGYFLGTPVCYVNNTSVSEILACATTKGGFDLSDRGSFFAALEEVSSMPHEEVRDCGVKLRREYHSARVTERILEVFREVASFHSPGQQFN